MGEIITMGQKTLIPQLKRWHRTGMECIGMEFNNQLVQINFKAEHVKIIIWTFESEMFITSIVYSRVETYSLDTQFAELARCRVLIPNVIQDQGIVGDSNQRVIQRKKFSSLI